MSVFKSWVPPRFHRHGAGAGAWPVPYLAPVLRVSTKILLVLVLRIRHRHGSLELLGPKSGTSNVTVVMGGAIPPATKVFADIFFHPSTKMMSENSENINEKSIQQWITDCPRGWDVQPVEVGDAPGKDTKRSKVRGQGPESPESNWFFIRIIYGPQIWAREMTKGMLWRKTVDGEIYLFYPEPSLIPNCTILYVCTFITTDSDVDTESGLGLSESWLLSKGDDTWGNLLSDVPVQSHDRFLVFWLDDRSMI